MLSLNLAKIRTAQERFDQVYPPDTFAADREEFTVVAPVTLGFDIFKDKQQFRLTGTVATTLELPCGRCLEPFSVTVEAAFDLQYRPRPASQPEADLEVREDDLSTAFYDDETIDLTQLMTEQFYLAVPMKPLCVESCRGLCVQCGVNLNKATCDCTPVWEDPRFAALKTLQDQSRRDH